MNLMDREVLEVLKPKDPLDECFAYSVKDVLKKLEVERWNGYLLVYNALERLRTRDKLLAKTKDGRVCLTELGQTMAKERFLNNKSLLLL